MIHSDVMFSLERNLEIMQPDLRRFFSIIKKIVEERKPITLKNRIFLWLFSLRHKELKDTVKFLMKKVLNISL